MLQRFDASSPVILSNPEQGIQDLFDARLMIQDQDPDPFRTGHIYEFDYTSEECGLANKEWESLKHDTKNHRVLLFTLEDWETDYE